MQPLIGNFTIPIGILLFAKMNEKQEELKTLDYVLEELEKIMKD
jgi:hypothetical protein